MNKDGKPLRALGLIEIRGRRRGKRVSLGGGAQGPGSGGAGQDEGRKGQTREAPGSDPVINRPTRARASLQPQKTRARGGAGRSPPPSPCLRRGPSGVRPGRRRRRPRGLGLTQMPEGLRASRTGRSRGRRRPEKRAEPEPLFVVARELDPGIGAK